MDLELKTDSIEFAEKIIKFLVSIEMHDIVESKVCKHDLIHIKATKYPVKIEVDNGFKEL